MVSKTQQNVPDSEEAKNNVSSSHSNKETSKSIITNDDPSLSMDKDSNRKRQVKTPEPEDSDEVLSDSEPSPKKTRRFFNSTSTVLRDHTLSNKLNQSKVESSASKTPSPRPTHKRKCSEKQLRSIDPADTISKTTKVNKKLTQVPLNSSNNYNRTAKETKNPTSSIFIANDEHKTKAHEKLKEDLRKDRKLSYLEEVFEQAGLILSDGYSANVLRTDQAVFVRDIKNAICSNEEESKRNVKQIMKDLEEYCSDDKCLKYAISSTETAEDCDVSRGATQDSVMRLLLHIDCLQAPVTELLLMDKLAKFIMDEPSGDLAVITWVRMILQCFRFLERMNNGKAVNDQLLEIVLVSTDTLIQQEVILSLPDIIQDTEHHYTALELSKLVRKSNPQVMTSALEALTNLSLQPEVRTQIQPTLLRAINKIPHDYLPTMLKFLFADGDAASVDEVITFLRNELDLEETSGNSASVQVLVFMTLRDALLVSRTLPTIWLKNISSVKTQAEHKPIDIVMLLVLLSVSSDNTRHRAIEAVFRSKIRAEMFTETLINETLKAYIPVIKEHFQVTIKLAGALLKSPEPAVVEFASKIYTGMFVNMEGLWCKWVLSDLQQGVGTGDTGMARAALSVIQHLTTNHHHKVKPLGVILMLLLNKLNDLALSEVCQLMDILCHIAYSEDDESSENCTMLQDEINILVQKQLASSQLSVKRNGIIGCVMTIKHVTTVSESTTDSLASEKNHTSDKAAKASQLLELLLSSTKDCVEAQGLALDQLSHLLISGKALDPTFVTKLSSLMRDKLQDDFLISASDFVSKDDVIETSLQFYLDDDPEGSIALNLADLVVNEQNSERMRSTVGVSCLHPLLRLLRGLEMSDLSKNDAQLG
ncbi:Fanconi anemia group D2 protein homolog [Macrosteles quadrilineatus]|uniref:Fanconi anemia group D2 protein homolog n=1 Tax=Macrosteles quadrilineatus TaxID=74068 RepID=UPI0023E0A5AC|nr:Fanconi anemia group D2 protein homolog [Macrosteles quadrilineatus]